MLSLFILFIIIIFEDEARGPDNEPVEIIFKIHAEFNESAVHLVCDHTTNIKSGSVRRYTVLEGEEFKIYTQSNSYIRHFICKDESNENVFNSYMEKSGSKDITIFKAERAMDAEWNCTVLLHRDNPATFLKVQYKDANYTAAYCNMWIHVRLRKSPQTILVNNMALQTVRTDLSEEAVEFTAEYQYADGDVVNVTCVNFLTPDDALLMMNYSTASAMSDVPTFGSKFPYRVMGFIANLNSNHNNTYMVCYNLIPIADVMVRFVMRTEFSIITVRINGMNVRPRKVAENNYIIDFKYESFHPINVVCEVQQTDLRLAVEDTFFLYVNNYSKRDLIPGKKAEMSFYLNRTHEKLNKLSCVASHFFTDEIAEKILISFTAGNFPLNEYSLHITSSNGRSMDSYGQHRLIIYEYDDGEILQIQCGPLLPLSTTRYNVSLHLGDSDECRSNGCVLSKKIKLFRRGHNTKIVCYLKGYNISIVTPLNTPIKEIVVSEITVILHARVLTTTSTTSTTTSTTSTTTSTTTTSPVTALTTVITTTSTAEDPTSSTTSPSNALVYWLSGVGVVVVAVILVIVYFIHKKRCCCLRTTSPELATIPTPRPHPATAYYENLLAIFRPINEREEVELEENHYEVVE